MVSAKEIDEVIRISDERTSRMLEGFNPVTGEGCPLMQERVLLEIPDFVFPKQWVYRCVYDNPLVQAVRYYGSMKRYVRVGLGMQMTEEIEEELTHQLILARAQEDPVFSFYIFDRIQDKETGQMVPFRCNYCQRECMEIVERDRFDGKPWRYIICKSRQWGGSLFTEAIIRWVQAHKREGWYAAILAQTADTSKRIKAMYAKMLQHTPGWMIGQDCKHLKFAPYQGSASDSVVAKENGDPARDAVIGIASYENYNAVRGSALSMVHYSEVAFWTKTDGKDANEVISSVSGAILYQPYTLVMIESTPFGMKGFYYDTYKAAKEGRSAYTPIFLAWWKNEYDRVPFRDADEKRKFAERLIKMKDDQTPPKGQKCPGTYYWHLFKIGATLEGLNWYLLKEGEYLTHEDMCTEAPSDDIEAFKSSGSMVFNLYTLDEREDEHRREPEFVGDIAGRDSQGKDAVALLRLVEMANGPLKVWSRPVTKNMMANRYVVSVDIGGRGQKSDYSVITVLDRAGMAPGIEGKVKVAARWRGHIRHDELAWKAIQIAWYYNKALLVFESNTYDMEKDSNTEGDHFESVLDVVGGIYPNMYVRGAAAENTSDKAQRKWGFQTNRKTKPKIIDNMVVYVDDNLYAEPDREAYKEMAIYERRDGNEFGNAPGPDNHDDIVMSTAIGLYISQYEMDPPTFYRPGRSTRIQRPMTEATL